MSADSLSSKDFRLSFGADIPLGPVHLYSDLVGTLVGSEGTYDESLKVSVDDRPGYYGHGTNHVRVEVPSPVRPWSSPLYPQGHLAILKGNLAPEGCVAKITGLKEPAITGPARVFDSENACMEAILART